ncbi:MAG: lamin tail domain-containing protein, partial [Planctomycetota bacterium]
MKNSFVGRALAGALVLSVMFSQGASAQDLLISEFLAINDGGLRDEDGDSSDWIEVTNVGATTVDLDGWALTDIEDERRWLFPCMDLEPGAYVVVFASAKDRSDAGDELHTNFSLRGDGEYLGLLRPDGQVEHDYAPIYPPQVENISYGISTESTSLVSRGGPLKYLVPTSGALGSSWTAESFNDNSWSDGTSGLGFDEGDGGVAGGAATTFYTFDGTLDDATGSNDGTYVGGGGPRYVEGVDGTPGGAIEFGGSDYVDVGTNSGIPVYNEPAYSIAAWVKGLPQGDRRIYSEGSSSNNTPLLTIGTAASGNGGELDLFIRTTSGTRLSHRLSDGIVFDGTWHHFVWVDQDGDARVYIDGELDPQDFSYNKTAMSLDVASIGAVLRASACCQYTGAVDQFGVWNRALSEDEIASLASGAGPGGLGYGSAIGTDLASDMLDENASVYSRFEFDVEDPAALSSLTLQLRYDDGFRAYVNGVAVASRNAPGAVSWNSSATVRHEGADALRQESIGVSGAIDSLEVGRNVLAIQGLNIDSADPSFLLAPELLASGGGASQRFFRDASPGEPNQGGSVDFVADTKFSVNRGFFDASFDVEITTATPGAQIRYTTDGTEPTSTTGTAYTGPVRIDETTTLRAAAFRSGYEPTNVDTNTYIFLEDVIRQRRPAGYPTSWAGNPADYDMDPEVCTDAGSPDYEPTIIEDLKAIPTMSLVLDPDDFHGSRGIYTNPLSRGIAWERNASIEIIVPEEVDPDGRDYQENCGVRVHGNSSARPIEGKHSLRLKFRSEYGASRMRYPLFEDSRVDDFDTIVLRCFSTDSWHFKDGGSRYRRWDSQYIRDVFMRDSHIAMGHPGAHSAYVHLYVNGVYWGLYNPSERPDDEFHASWQGDEAEDWDVIKDFNESFRGNRASWDQLMSLANAGLGSDTAYQRVQGNDPDGTRNPAFPVLLDVPNLIDYMILHLWGCSEDWPHHNFFAARSRTENSAGWRFYTWDQEIVLDFVYRNRLNVSNNNSPAIVYSRLRQNPEFRLRFGDHVQRHLFHDGVMTVDATNERYTQIADHIDRAIVGESARWGDFREDVPDPGRTAAELYTRDRHWVPERDKVLDEYLPESHRLAIERFRSGGLYPSVEPPILNQHGGAIPRGFQLGITAPAGTVYFTTDGTDPREYGGAVSPDALEAGEAAGVTLVEEGATGRYLVPTGPALDSTWMDFDFDDAGWVQGSTAVGYERGSGYEDHIDTDTEAAMYDVNATVYTRVEFDVDDPALFTFLRLAVKYDDGYIAYLNGVEVMSRNEPDDPQWNSRAGGSHADGLAVVPEVQDITASLNLLRAGRNVLAFHGLNATERSSDFLLAPSLVAGAASKESGVQLDRTTRLLARSRLGNEWSALIDTTFFLDEPLPLRITEIMYHPPAQFGDSPYSDEDFEFVELANIGAEAISLERVALVNGIRFQFSEGAVRTLEPGEIVLVVRDLDAFSSRYDTAGLLIAGEYVGGLDNGGELLRLVDPLGQIVHEFSYDDDWYPMTDGRGVSLEVVDATAPTEDWGSASQLEASGSVLGTPGSASFVPPVGGRQRIGDANQDGNLDLSDAIQTLRFLFLGAGLDLPCEGASVEDAGNLVIFDSNGDGNVDLSDPVHVLAYLFLAGDPPAAGT